MHNTVQSQFPGDAEHRGNVSMGKRALYGESFINVFIYDPSFQHGFYAVNNLWRKVGKIGEGFLSYAVSFTPCPAQEYGGSAFSVGDNIHMVGHGNNNNTIY